MRMKLLLLALLLTSVVGLSSPRAEAAAAPNHSCSTCTTYPDGSTCCVSCMCDGSGRIIWCTDNFCP